MNKIPVFSNADHEMECPSCAERYMGRVCILREASCAECILGDWVKEGCIKNFCNKCKKKLSKEGQLILKVLGI